MTINGTLSTALANPLYPIGAGFSDVTYISTTGYLVTTDSAGAVVNIGGVFFASSDCTGNAWRSLTNTNPRGTVFSVGPTTTGTTPRLYYLPRNPVIVAQPLTRNSQSAAATSPCAVATTTLTNATGYYLLLPNDPAVTGVSLAPDGLTIQLNYVP